MIRDDSDESWRDHAKCKGLPPEMFIPGERGGTLAPVMAICNGQDHRPVCPVRDACGRYAETHGCVGVWGGRYHADRASRRTLVPVQVVESFGSRPRRVS